MGVGGFGGIMWCSRGEEGAGKLSLTECKGGDRRNLTAGKTGGCQNITEPRGGEGGNR